MSFTYSTIKTETLAEGDRLFLGYNVGGSGVVMNVRLRYQTPGQVPTKEHTFYLPGDTVSGLQSGMSGSPFTALKTDDLGNNVTRYVRAYKTPAGNVLLHDYMVVVVTLSDKTHTIHADEHFCVIEAAALSGTDITKTARRGSIGTSGATEYLDSASWQDVLVAPSSSDLSLSVVANANDVLDTNLVFSVYNALGSMSIEVRIVLDSVEIAWCKNEHESASVDRNYSVRGTYVIPAAGTYTLKVQLFTNDGGGFNKVIQHYGAARGKLEYRLFYP